MASLRRIFTDHPASVGESYFEHMQMSASFGARMLLGACACFVHALVPSLCARTGSSQVRALHSRMVAHRDRREAEPPQRETADAEA